MIRSRSLAPTVILAVILGLALVAAACGGSTGATASATPEPPATASGLPGVTGVAASAAGDCATPAPLGSATGGSACSVPLPSASAASPGGSVASPSGFASCSAPASPTPSQTEGPYFKAGSPEKATLVEPGMTGTPLTLIGFVVTTGCLPVAGATVDVWQADASGAYDNAGYRLRGHVLTDAAGRFTIETIVPGEYPGRTEHVHVKVTPSGGSTLTTQVYFPGVSANDADGIYNPELLLDVTPEGEGFIGAFTFVLAT